MKAADRVLEALRATGPDAYRADPDRLDTWWACCPCCNARGAGERSLAVMERGACVDLICSTCCDPDAILRALREAERNYPPGGWPDDPEHPCPAWDGALADALLEQKRRQRRQTEAEARLAEAP